MIIRVNVNNPADRITEWGTGAKLYWERDNASATGSFTSASGSVLLDPAVSQYEINDSTGLEGHYYRTRVGNSAGTDFSPYDDVEQAGAPQAYADLDTLREHQHFPDDATDNHLSDLLLLATRFLNEELGRDFFRHPPVSGTETRVVNGSGRSGRIWIEAGIQSLTTVSMATATDQAYVALAATDWTYWPLDKQADEPYSAVELKDTGAYSYWYSGTSTVQLTGVFGWAEPPGLIQKATVDIALEWYRRGMGGGGGPVFNQFGTPIFGGPLPLTAKLAIQRYDLRQKVR